VNLLPAGPSWRALLVALSLALTAAPAAAADWSRTDTALTGAALTGLAVDWGQTRTIARNPARFNELNPFLGEHPSVGRVDRYFALAMLGTVGLAIALPSEYRKIFLYGLILRETAVVITNYSIGIRASF
jgi:hypothetical protein